MQHGIRVSFNLSTNWSRLPLKEPEKCPALEPRSFLEQTLVSPLLPRAMASTPEYAERVISYGEVVEFRFVECGMMLGVELDCQGLAYAWCAAAVRAAASAPAPRLFWALQPPLASGRRLPFSPPADASAASPPPPLPSPPPPQVPAHPGTHTARPALPLAWAAQGRRGAACLLRRRARA